MVLKKIKIASLTLLTLVAASTFASENPTNARPTGGVLFVVGPPEYVNTLIAEFDRNGGNLENARTHALQTISTDLLVEMAIDCLIKDPGIDWILRLLNTAADRGNSTAMVKLAALHIHGIFNFKGDLLTGLNWLAKAAEMKNGDAFFKLGCLYRSGQYGLEKCERKALRCFKLAQAYGSRNANVAPARRE